MYHRLVSSSPRCVEAIICSGDASPDPARKRLSTYGVTSTPVLAAEERVSSSDDSLPARIQSVLVSASPLSKTLLAALEEVVTTKGAASKPGADGSLHNRSPAGPSRSPTRVPPPGRLKTVRPSAASRPAALNSSVTIRSATALGGSNVSYRPGGSSTRREDQRSRCRNSASTPSVTDRSDQSRVDCPHQVDPPAAGSLAVSSR